MATTELGSQYEQHLERLREREWRLEDVPFYKPGEAPDFNAYEHLDYVDVYEQVWGRPCGENGIGRLREVAITRITEAEFAIFAGATSSRCRRSRRPTRSCSRGTTSSSTRSIGARRR
jgi:hypothetical protein